jgi:hypothetical protein
MCITNAFWDIIILFCTLSSWHLVEVKNNLLQYELNSLQTALKLSVVSSSVWDWSAPPQCLMICYSRSWWKNGSLVLRPPARGSTSGTRWLSSFLPCFAAVVCFLLLCHRRMACLVPCECVSHVVHERHSGLFAQRQWQPHAEVHQCLGPCFLLIAAPYSQLLLSSYSVRRLIRRSFSVSCKHNKPDPAWR